MFKPKNTEVEEYPEEDFEEEIKKGVVRKPVEQEEKTGKVNLTQEDMIALIKDYNNKIASLLEYL